MTLNAWMRGIYPTKLFSVIVVFTIIQTFTLKKRVYEKIVSQNESLTNSLSAELFPLRINILKQEIYRTS